MKRIFHHWEKWECVTAGMYASSGLDHDSAALEYAGFLRDTARFRAAPERVGREWPVSCEQFLSNESMNRIAWLGQAAMCIETGVPREFRSGFKLLTDAEQQIANQTAAEFLRTWADARQG